MPLLDADFSRIRHYRRSAVGLVGIPTGDGLEGVSCQEAGALTGGRCTGSGGVASRWVKAYAIARSLTL